MGRTIGKNEYLCSKEEQACYGCSMCEAACPVHAIQMVQNEKGFFYPCLDEARCIQCGRCAEVCPVSMERGEKISTLYAVEHKSEEVLKESQSGGMFTLLSDFVLERGGTVYGALFNEKLEVVHGRAENKPDRDRMRGSKYVQSRISSELIRAVKRDLEEGRQVLFTGNPCQCAMIQKSFGCFSNLVTCDFICHGTPSPRVYRDYLKSCTEKWGEVKKVVFRNKRYKVNSNQAASIYTAEGQEYISNDYGALFFSHLAHRSSCFSCQFASETRYTDFTMGDFHDQPQIGFTGRYDVSMCFVNTQKAERIFEEIKHLCVYLKRPIAYFKNQPCLYGPIGKPETYNAFWEDYDTHGFTYIVDKYVTDELKEKYHLKF